MNEATKNPAPPASSARRRYLAYDPADGWTLTTPVPPADYHIVHSWPRGDRRRLDLEMRDDGDGWRISVVGWCYTDIVVGRGVDALQTALRFFLPFTGWRAAI
jgi:hypothetical protein